MTKEIQPALQVEYTSQANLTLSATDGFYYAVLPSGHESEGVFTFSVDRASRELNKTIEYLKGKML